MQLLPNFMLSCLTILELLSLFLELNVCNVRIYINGSVQRDVKMLRGCVDMQLPCQFLSAPAGFSTTVDVLLFNTQFDIHRILDLSEFFLIRCCWLLKFKLRLKIVSCTRIEVGVMHFSLVMLI